MDFTNLQTLNSATVHARQETGPSLKGRISLCFVLTLSVHRLLWVEFQGVSRSFKTLEILFCFDALSAPPPVGGDWVRLDAFRAVGTTSSAEQGTKHSLVSGSSSSWSAT